MPEYAPVPKSAIHPPLGEAVGRVVAAAARDLGLKRLRVQFVVVVDDERRIVRPPEGWPQAFTTPQLPDTISMSPFCGDPIRTVLHEARHVWQYHDHASTAPEGSSDAEEADAEGYADDAMARLGLSEPPDDMPRIRERNDR